MLLPAFAAHAQSVPNNTGNCLSSREAELVDRINLYRQVNGLGPIAVSRWLATTGQWHSWDLTANNPVFGNCTMHSWSSARPMQWNPVCYAGPGQADGMWYKPREISGQVYTAIGFEIAAVDLGTISAFSAMQAWANSPAHADVILNRGVWSGQTWRGMGVGMVGEYAVAWFGNLTDPGGTMAPCTNGGSPIDEIFDNRFE